MEEPDSPEEPEVREVESRPARHGGFFSIYKKGQGYWTRMGTALGAAILITVTALFVFEQAKFVVADWFSVPPIVEPPNASNEQLAQIRASNTANAQHAAGLRSYTVVGATAGVILVGVVFAWRLMNKPRNVDFLIATDGEMKKVNWTSRRELFGSTRVVIVFMVMIAIALFLIDVLTGLFFQIIGLLKFGPLS